MDKTVIRNFAIWARNKLISDISYQAGLVGVTANGIKSALPQSTGQTEFFDIGTSEPYAISGEAIRQRQHLVELIEQKTAETNYKTAYKYVIEEVAYTWFNRLIAIRFMEVNDYLPWHVRVLSSESSKTEPDIVTAPFDTDIEYSEKERQLIIYCKNNNKLDELFRMLFIKQCNSLNDILPALFEKTEDYSELLLNISAIDKEGIVYRLVNDINEDDFNVEKGGQVEIIGWLYQYYNTEPKSSVDANVKKGIKVTKHELPAKTQIFTPDWVVRFMSDNSLGRIWIEGHPDSNLKNSLKYYVDNNVENEKKDNKIAPNLYYSELKPEKIKCIDPCMGSGHILCALFDILVRIYEECGYSSRDAASSIIENNLWGLDVDARATQLAYFAVMMKARQYDRRFLTRGIQPHVYAIEESNGLRYDGDYSDFLLDTEHQRTLNYMFDVFKDAKEYGSIIDVQLKDYDGFLKAWRLAADRSNTDLQMLGWFTVSGEKIFSLANQAKALSQKYDIVITNPPYLGNGDMNEKLSEYVQNKYPIAKSDTYSTFMLRCRKMLKESGFQSMVTMQSWMNLGAFESLRKQVCETQDIITLWHLDDSLLGIAYQTCAFVLRGRHNTGFKGTYYLATKEDYSKYKENMYKSLINPHYSEQDAYLELSGCPIAYSLSKRCIEAYVNSELMSTVMTTREGMTTGSNDVFLRLWYEIESIKMNSKWFPYNKGGDYRKWYGNDEYLVNWEDDGVDIQNFKDEKSGRIRSHNYNGEYAFREGITWSAFSSKGATFRYSNDQYLFDSKGSKGFCSTQLIPYILAFLNSAVCETYLAYFAGAKDKKPGHIISLPYRYSESHFEGIVQMVHECIEIEKKDWDSFETSWGFKKHPLI